MINYSPRLVFINEKFKMNWMKISGDASSVNTQSHSLEVKA